MGGGDPQEDVGPNYLGAVKYGLTVGAGAALGLALMQKMEPTTGQVDLH